MPLFQNALLANHHILASLWTFPTSFRTNCLRLSHSLVSYLCWLDSSLMETEILCVDIHTHARLPFFKQAEHAVSYGQYEIEVFMCVWDDNIITERYSNYNSDANIELAFFSSLDSYARHPFKTILSMIKFAESKVQTLCIAICPFQVRNFLFLTISCIVFTNKTQQTVKESKHLMRISYRL